MNDRNKSIERPIHKTIFNLEITNGYVFRQIFELYDRLVIQGIPVFFKEDGITIRTGTTGSRNNRKLISDIELFTDDIIKYEINTELSTIARDNDLGEEPCHIEQFGIGNMRNICKSIAKSNNIRMYKTTECDDVIIEVRGLTTEKSRLFSGKYQSINYDISHFIENKPKPNIKIDINQFCTTLKGMTRGEAEYTSFKVFENGLIVEGKNSHGKIMKDGRWGNVPDEYTGDDYVETKVNSSIVKAIYKISSMSTYSIVKVSSIENGYLKLNHKVSDFGEHNIFLLDSS